MTWLMEWGSSEVEVTPKYYLLSSLFKAIKPQGSRGLFTLESKFHIYISLQISLG